MPTSLNLATFWAAGPGLTPRRSLVAERSIEITAVPALLRRLELAGCIVTSDALRWRKETLREITEAVAAFGDLRRLAVDLLRREKSLDRGIHREQLHAALNPAYLCKLLKI